MLRFYRLSEIPIELFSDELINYVSAKQLIHTGADLFGNRHIYFTDRLELRPPLYGYLAYFSSLIFGENAYAIRFPAALLGTLQIPLVVILSYLIYKNRLFSFISGLLYASLPWAVHYSHIGWEPASFLFFFLTAIIFFIFGISRKSFLISLLGSLAFGICFYTYNSTIFWVFVFIPTIMVISYISGQYKLNIAQTCLTILSVLILALPYIFLVFTQPLALDRARSISTFKNGFTIENLVTFFHNYVSHYSYNFLFISGDSNLRHSVQTGQLYIWWIPFLMLGVIYIISTARKHPYMILVIMGLVTYPLGGSLTNDGAPHATRSLLGSVWLPIASAYGIEFLYSLAKKIRLFRKFKIANIFLSLLIVVTIISSIKLIHAYDKYRYTSAPWWEHGNEAVFTKLKQYAESAPALCLGNVNYWNSQVLIQYYIPTYRHKTYESIDEPNCATKNAILVVPKNYIVNDGQMIIDTTHTWDNNLQYLFVRVR